jgi:hypothetical protein
MRNIESEHRYEKEGSNQSISLGRYQFDHATNKGQ